MCIEVVYQFFNLGEFYIMFKSKFLFSFLCAAVVSAHAFAGPVNSLDEEQNVSAKKNVSAMMTLATNTFQALQNEEANNKEKGSPLTQSFNVLLKIFTHLAVVTKGNIGNLQQTAWVYKRTGDAVMELPKIQALVLTSKLNDARNFIFSMLEEARAAEERGGVFPQRTKEFDENLDLLVQHNDQAGLVWKLWLTWPKSPEDRDVVNKIMEGRNNLFEWCDEGRWFPIAENSAVPRGILSRRGYYNGRTLEDIYNERELYMMCPDDFPEAFF